MTSRWHEDVNLLNEKPLFYPGCPAPDITTVKGFLRYYNGTHSGVLQERPTVSSTINTAERFFAGFERVTGTSVPDADKKEASNVR